MLPESTKSSVLKKTYGPLQSSDTQGSFYKCYINVSLWKVTPYQGLYFTQLYLCSGPNVGM